MKTYSSLNDLAEFRKVISAVKAEDLKLIIPVWLVFIICLVAFKGR